MAHACCRCPHTADFINTYCAYVHTVHTSRGNIKREWVTRKEGDLDLQRREGGMKMKKGACVRTMYCCSHSSTGCMCVSVSIINIHFLTSPN